MMKEDFDLVPAVEDYCRTLAERARIQVAFARDGQARPMSSESALTIFRTLQEALANATRHGGASQVDVKLEFEVDRLLMTVRDNGGGFDPRASKDGHYGLANMGERARKVGGSLDVDSAPGRGTLIALQIPYRTGQSGIWGVGQVSEGEA